MQPNTLSLRNFCQPIDDGTYKSNYDLRTQAAADIIKAVTTPGSLPSGYIDRKTFSPNSDPVTPREEWVNDANQELSATTPVNIKVAGKYNFPDSTVTADVTLVYTSSVNDSNFISVAIIEDDIMDLQEKKNLSTGNVDILTDYVHQHVLLDMMTANTGDLLNTSASKSLVAGRVFVKRYTAVIKPHASALKLKVVAFVHKGSNAKYYVLQAKEADIK